MMALVGRFLQKYWIFFLYLIVALTLLYPVTMGDGIPFKYDWSWPIFDMRYYWQGIMETGPMGVMGISAKNMALLLGILGVFKVPTAFCLKFFLVAVHTVAGYGFYVFVKDRVSSCWLAFVTSVAYAFTPYIFIRTILGYGWSLIAYALLPVFLHVYLNKQQKRWWYYLLIGFLLSLIFSQIQAGLLVSLVLFIDLVVSIKTGSFRKKIKDFVACYVTLVIVNLPWVIISLVSNDNLGIVSGGAATTYQYISMLPHSFRHLAMLADHQITDEFFQYLSHTRYYLAGFSIIWLIVALSIFSKRNRYLVVVFLLSLVLITPFLKGPLGPFGNFYTWFADRFPQMAVFRETYHFEFLIAFVLILLFAFGADELLRRLDSYRALGKVVNTGVKSLVLGSLLFVIAPYLTFDYAGYLRLQTIPVSYNELYRYLESDEGKCSKAYYPPGLGFVYFRGDETPNAANVDLIARAMNTPFLDDGTTYSYLPSQERFYRNELVSQFYEREDRGEFTALLAEGGINCVIVRTDMGTMYKNASNLGGEEDPAIRSKWLNEDILALTRSKQGLVQSKQFGQEIYLFKPTTAANTNLTTDNIEQLPTEIDNKAIYLPITDWAREFAYYKDGWSRGRYDFWRKHLFTELRQDFIYTDREKSTLEGKIAHRGSYEVWARYLTGGTDGSFEISIDDFRVTVSKENGEERFVWRKLGQINAANDRVIIRNIQGENAIADLVLVGTK